MRMLIAGLALLLATAVCPQANPAQEALSEGRRLEALGQFDEALKAYETALQAAESDLVRAAALLGAAKVHQAQQEPELAIQRYRLVLTLKEVPPGFRQMALRQMASTQRRMDDTDGARETYELLLAELTDPDERVSVLLGLVQLERELGQDKEAAQRLQKLIRDMPESGYLPEAYKQLVELHAESGDLKAAEAAARQGLKRFPDQVELLWVLGQAYEQAGKQPEAVTTFQEMALKTPENPEPVRRIYELRQADKTVPELVKWLKKQAQADVLGTAWLEHLARLSEWEDDLPAALRVQEQIVAKRPTDANVLAAAGRLALRVEAYDQAAKWLEQALGVNPEDESLVEALGEVQLRQGHTEQALEVWKRGLRYSPGRKQSVLRLAGVLAAHDLHEQAVQVYLEGRQAAGDPLAYALNLGSVYEDKGEPAAAVREYVAAAQSPGRGAGERLFRLVENEEARAEVVRLLTETAQAGPLPAEAAAALVYAKALAGEDLEAALAALPKDDGQGQSAASMLQQLAARLEYSERPQAAAECYRRLLREDLPPDEAALPALRLAEVLSEAGKWQEALATLRKLDLRAVRPLTAAQVALRMGDLLLRRAHQPTEATGAYEIAIQRDPQGQTALRARWGQADALFALGEYDQALEGYEELAGAPEPEEPDYLPMPPGLNVLRPARPLPQEDYVAYQAAEAAFRQGKPEAEAAFREVAANNPASEYANDALQRVVLLQKMKLDATGAGTYREALRARERGETPRAEELLKQVTSPALGDAALLLLGQMQIEQERQAEAVQTLDRLAEAYPESPLAPEGLLLAAQVQALTSRAEAAKRLQALLERYPEAAVAEEAQVLERAWMR